MEIKQRDSKGRFVSSKIKEKCGECGNNSNGHVFPYFTNGITQNMCAKCANKLSKKILKEIGRILKSVKFPNSLFKHSLFNNQSIFN